MVKFKEIDPGSSHTPPTFEAGSDLSFVASHF